MSDGAELLPIQQLIWEDKYRFGDEKTIEDTWGRISLALAQAENEASRCEWQDKFYKALVDFQFIPAGRILAGAGTDRRNVSLFNCKVSGTISDSMDGIFSKVREAALTMQAGCGIGMDFSPIRPRGAPVLGVGADASGPVSFMDVWDAMCKTIMSAGNRRGAMMATLRCDHPDIEEFIEAKSDPLRLRNFNLSVLITDKFMEAVKAKLPWDLVFNGEVCKTIDAKYLFEKITRRAYDYAEPGVIFIDRVNHENNLGYIENISATNPCGEQPLPPYGACLLGSLNLVAFVHFAFGNGGNPHIDKERLFDVTKTAVRMLDNVIDISNYPLEEQRKEAKAKRRIGLGITGLGDTLAMMGLRYDSREALVFAGQLMKDIALTAYATSIGLAKEKGKFPLFNGRYYKQPFIQSMTRHALEKDYAIDIFGKMFGEYGIRNSHLTSIAPTGTISLLAGNVSSGVEPIFDWEYERKILLPDGSKKTETVTDFAVGKWRELYGNAPLPPSFVRAHDLTPGAHLAMQAALQPFIDTSISKTVNCPADMPFEEFQGLYWDAYNMGLKCCAAYRPNEITGSILSAKPESGPIDIGGGMTAQSKYIGAFPSNSSDINVTIPPAGKIEVKLNDGRQGKILNKEGSRAELASDLKSSEIYTAMAEDVNMPLAKRGKFLSGRTYKIMWPPASHAFYITINNDEFGDPYEIFINSKNLESYAWTVALTRMVSAIFRRGGNIDFVTEELQAVFDPKGGAWMDGKYVPSLLAAIGNTIKAHIDDDFNLSPGLAQRSERLVVDQETAVQFSQPGPIVADDTTPGIIEAIVADALSSAIGSSDVRLVPRVPKMCPKCNSDNVRIKTGCVECLNCGFSNCE